MRRPAPRLLTGALLAVTVMLGGCPENDTDPDPNNVTCAAVPICQSGQVEVESCADGDATCMQVTECGDSIFCADVVTEDPCACADTAVPVNACESWDTECTGLDACTDGGLCKTFTPPVYPLEGCSATVEPGADPEATTTALLTAIIESSAGDLLCLKNGHYLVTEQLALTAGIELRGETMEGTILDFAQQETGANGLLVQPGPDEAAIFTQFTVKNTKGDGIRVEKADKVTFRYMTATWDGGPREENGAYGLYPVQCSDVLIEHSKAYNASDAGIYVGQSQNIIVRDSEAAYNVAGIEIENSNDADVHDNLAHFNTGGVLVFNLPNLAVKTGARTKVHNNQILSNNTDNFAPEGNIVAAVPPGTGVLVIAADDTEIHDNMIKDNRAIGVAAVSYQTLQRDDYREDTEYDPFTERMWVHDNIVENNGYDVPPPPSLAGLIRQFARVPVLEDFLWDGFVNDEVMPADRINCWSDNTREDMATGVPWRNFVAAELPDASNHSTELGDHDCMGTALPRITID